MKPQTMFYTIVEILNPLVTPPGIIPEMLFPNKKKRGRQKPSPTSTTTTYTNHHEKLSPESSATKFIIIYVNSILSGFFFSSEGFFRLFIWTKDFPKPSFPFYLFSAIANFYYCFFFNAFR